LAARRRHRSSALDKRRRNELRQQDVPVPHFSLLANLTSRGSIEEWMKAPPATHQDEITKAAFTQWSSVDQCRFISELGHHGEAKSVVIFVNNYARRETNVFNAALSTLVDLNCLDEFQNVLNTMTENDIPFSSFTLETVFRAAQGPKEVVNIRNIYQSQTNLWTSRVFEAAILSTVGDDTQYSWETVLTIRNNWMKESNVHPTVSIYVAMFQMLQSLPQQRTMEDLHTLLNEVLATADANPESFYIDDRLWGIILKSFAVEGGDSTALEILRLMNNRGAVPNARHCTTFIKSLSRSKKYDFAVQFLNSMANLPDSGCYEDLRTSPPDQIAVLAVLSTLAASKNYEAAYAVLQNMKNKKYGEVVTPNEQAYNLVLSACNSPIGARELVREMRLTRRHRTGVIPPSLRTYSSAIAVCRRSGDLAMALRLFDLVKDDGLDPDVYIYTAVMWTAAEVGNFRCARLLLEEMENIGMRANVVSYNGLLAAYASANRISDLVCAFEELQDHTDATTTTFQIILRTARTIQQTSDRCNFLQQIYERMKIGDKNMSIGGRMLEAYIFSLGSEGRFEEAKAVFDSITGSSDAPILRAVMFACSNSNPPAWQDALELLHTSDIFIQSSPPAFVDSVALAYAMIACSKADQWEQALNLLQLYGNKNTSTVAFNSLIAACGRSARPDVAIQVLNEMEHHGVDPDVRSFRHAIIACNQAEHARSRLIEENEESAGVGNIHEGFVFEWWECALSLLRRMKETGLTPDIQTYSSCISACEAAGQWQRALGVLQGIDEKEKNLYCYNAAISACEKGGAWVEAVDLYERMKARGGRLKPNFVTVSGVVEVC
jgi:pentatricopeptide repeat domain-containing protein 1